MDYVALKRAIYNTYFPKIRGLSSKKKRLRKKAQKKWDATHGIMRSLIYSPNPLLERISESMDSYQTGVITAPLTFGETELP